VTLPRVLLGLALALIVALLGVETAATSSPPTADKKAPKPLKLRETCVRRAERTGVVRFRAADGVRLLGVMLGRGPAAVVLAHEGNVTLCSWLPYGRALARRGYRVLVFDARGHGSSSSSRRPGRSFRVDLDVAAGVRELRRRGAKSVVLAGGSYGAMASIAAGSFIRPAVDGVVPVSPGVSFRDLDAEASARRLNVPTLFVVAQEDADFPQAAQAARTLYEATATQEKQLLVVAGYGHGSAVLSQSPEARAAVDRFIDDRSRRRMRARAPAEDAAPDLRR
jgi:pimeloyl-ACP methyl ester carboxylesterase